MTSITFDADGFVGMGSSESGDHRWLTIDAVKALRRRHGHFARIPAHVHGTRSWPIPPRSPSGTPAWYSNWNARTMEQGQRRSREWGSPGFQRPEREAEWRRAAALTSRSANYGRSKPARRLSNFALRR